MANVKRIYKKKSYTPPKAEKVPNEFFNERGKPISSSQAIKNLKRGKRVHTRDSWKDEKHRKTKEW